jgi:hypothetical protein
MIDVSLRLALFQQAIARGDRPAVDRHEENQPSTSTKKIRVNWSASSATGTEPADAKHFAWRTTLVANELPKTGHNAAGPRSSSLLAA